MKGGSHGTDEKTARRVAHEVRWSLCLLWLRTGWHADHVEAALRKWKFGDRQADGTRRTVATGDFWRPENDAIENLFPACAPCNLFKATFTVEDFRKQITAQAERARAYSVNFRTAERFGLVEVVDKPVVFWFERYQEGEAS